MKMTKKEKLSFLISLTIHVLVLFGPIQGSKDAPPNKEKQKTKKEHKIKITLEHKGFIPKEVKRITVKQKKLVKKSKKKRQPPKKKELKCKDGRKYIGVGFTHRGLGMGYDEVIGIAPGYAADRAGLRVGDEIIGIIDLKIGPTIEPLWKLKSGKVGDPVTFIIQRKGSTIELEMIREEVCTVK